MRYILVVAVMLIEVWCAVGATVTCGPTDNPVAQAALCKPGDVFEVLSNTTVSGVTTHGVDWILADNGTNVHMVNCTIDLAGAVDDKSGGGFFIGAGVTNSSITGCTITNCSAAAAIYGYPGSNVTISKCTIVSPVGDGIHLAAAAGNNATISGCVVTGCHRIGVELQLSGLDAAVSGCYVSLVQPTVGSYMAYSLACGNSSGLTVTGDVAVSDRLLGAAFEVMGYGVSLQSCVSHGFAQFLLNGAQGPTVTCSGDTIYGGVFAANDGVSWPIAAIRSPEAVLPLSAAPAPSPPGQGPGAPTPSALKATPGPGGTVVLAFPALVAPAELSAYPTTTGLSTAVALGTLPAGATTATVGNVPSGWQVTCVLSGVVSNDVSAAGGPVTTVFAPTLVGAPATQPAAITYTSADGGNTIVRKP